jgi:hypothetical protein
LQLPEEAAMTHFKTFIKRVSLGLLIVPLLGVYTPPASLIFAEEAAPSPGPTQPNGADAETYHYNEATGMWENDYYIWNPVTRKTQPKQPTDYSYNPETGMWDTTEWRYDTPSGTYKPNVTSVSQPPAGSSTPAQAVPDPEPSTNTTTDTTNSGAFSEFYDAAISNNLTSTALSGDAAVMGNTTGGSATTGSAAAISNLFNLLQSSAPFSDLGSVSMFRADVDGDVVGDLYIDPTMLAALQPASSSNNLASTTHINVSSDAAINNDVALNAASGDATVSGNTKAGDATTGSADAVLNLINLLNSSIAAGHTFLGLLNITGSLDGDILLPPGTLGALLASGSSNADVTNTVDQHVDADFTNNQAINNNVITQANSGNAKVDNNTSAGNASTGNARTNLTLLNLTGHDVIASNSLLVFVNVLGQWIGGIINAPAGSTSAALGGNVSQHNTIKNDVDIEATSNSAINNNVSVNAETGDATVENNTSAGNARSGDATASANIGNLINSNFALSDWFGVLFINVFNKWNGSFGIDTEAGNRPAPPSTAAQTATAAAPSIIPQVFRFATTKTSSSSPQNAGSSAGVTSSTAESSQEDDGHVLAASKRHNGGATPTFAPGKPDLTVAAIAILTGGVLVGIERLLAIRSQRKLA